MDEFTLRQGDVIAKLSQVGYQPEKGFQEDNTWYVAEASISAESDTKLANGPATIEHGETKFPVTVTVLELEASPGEEDEEPDWGNAECMIEIGYADGLQKLASALGLL